ncbi:bis(5'-nucleosyl)-tetraphosphatase (symmetrical) YqeK [Mangrovibacillus cuniculi]|uniref:bis(5'-nucleosyl)-tetraphosphatase (symmetrical) n=1 Tax=Mangrovibacillus cuniculi TaxID=2593652 RepID=A0A7S8HFZ5_9BACI|nr:bis(5'-nucleosyl)-tetraphosphatase (symmetrical) YqeK [Mangrovibacillus cuniculi]QPC46955.1 HD domain-containing protein [Mangrovibacillus cuniculi]
MNREEALAFVKPHLTEKRYIHTIGVMETAITLASKYAVDQKKAELAAIFHDYAKFRDLDEMRNIIVQKSLDPLLLSFHSELWHAPVGALLVQQEIGIVDEEILSAIRYHTSGRKEMTELEKIIYVADYIEPGRDFPGVEEVRKLAEVSLDAALKQSVKNTINFLLKKEVPIYPDTLNLYNWIVTKGE